MATIANVGTNDALVAIREHISYGLRFGVRGDSSEREFNEEWLEDSIITLRVQMAEAAKENADPGLGDTTGYEQCALGVLLDAALDRLALQAAAAALPPPQRDRARPARGAGTVSFGLACSASVLLAGHRLPGMYQTPPRS
jgi:hypothetical protein